MLDPVLLFYVTLVISIILPRIPYIGKFFRILNTMVHETGHAIIGTIFLGDVHRIVLSPDTSGRADLSIKNRLATFFITLSGYTFPPLVACLMFYLTSEKQPELAILTILFIAIIDLIIYVRNIFGIFWLLLFISISVIIIGMPVGTIAGTPNPLTLQLYPVFLAGMLLSDNISDLIQLLVISYHNPKQTGDAKGLSDSTHIHPMVWVILFLGFSLYMAFLSISRFPSTGG